MGAVMAMDTGTADADTITDGTEAAVTTNGATIAAGKAFAPFAFVIPIALTKCKWQRCERSRPRGAAGSAVTEPQTAQPSPISTAMRIRSE